MGHLWGRAARPVFIDPQKIKTYFTWCRRRLQGAVKKTTQEACEKKYVAADEAYRVYLNQRALEKFGEYTKAAKAVKRSRAHLHDCIAGKRGLDSVRRLVGKIEAAEVE